MMSQRNGNGKGWIHSATSNRGVASIYAVIIVGHDDHKSQPANQEVPEKLISLSNKNNWEVSFNFVKLDIHLIFSRHIFRRSHLSYGTTRCNGVCQHYFQSITSFSSPGLSCYSDLINKESTNCDFPVKLYEDSSQSG